MKFQLKPVVTALLLAGLHISSVNALPAAQLDAQQVAAEDVNPALAAALAAWQQGQLNQAIERFSAMPAVALNFNSQRLHAEALEAAGHIDAAVARYRQLLTTSSEPAERHYLQLKLALLDGSAAAFGNYLSEHPQLGVALAKIVNITRGSSEALALLETMPAEQSSNLVLKTSWLLATGQSDAAEEAAWQAYEQADSAADKHYALALYAEAIRHNKTIDRALSKLAKLAENPFTTPLYLDLLQEAGLYQQALTVTEHSGLADIQARRISLLTQLGNSAALEQHYREQISKQPQDPLAYYGLAGLLINRGDSQAARQVFSLLGDNNPTHKSLLLNAAKRMVAMNMRSDAIALLNTHLPEAMSDPQISLFVFETHLSAGEDSQARAILERMQANIAPDSPTMLAIAQGYEQLNSPQLALQILLNYQQNGGVLAYEQQLHIADLANATGEHALAIQQWQSLWHASVLPARKHYLEGLLVKASQQHSTITSQIDTLEQALVAGKIARHQLNLLVALYLADNQLEQAEQAINRFARQTDLAAKARLEMLASVYGRSRAYQKLNQVWQELAQLDPDNAQQYWQQITLNSLRNNTFSSADAQPGQSPQQQRLAQVDALIAQLSRLAGGADPKFNATLYSMADLTQAAIGQYQLALSQRADADTLLQLVELMKKQGAIAQAASLLQWQIVNANSNQHFMAASDGLLSVFDNNQQGNDRRIAVQLRERVLSWLQTQILLRLAGTDDDSSLLMLLADIAQSLGEFDRAERINNMLLAQNSHQRAALLRSMINQFGGQSGQTQSSAPAIGNSAKQLTYGRRLLALKHEFPPALYAKLGRALLADGDIQGAERAFSLMTDIPGLLNVRQLKADAYASQHYDAQALTYFQQAVQIEQSNFELLNKTAVLEEQFNHPAIANYWYWLGLEQLLNQTASYQPGAVNRRLSDTFRYYPSLSEGFLLTLSANPARAEVLAELQQLFRRSLAESDNQASTAAEDFPRLQLIADLLQRSAFALDQKQAWQQSLALLHSRFPDSRLWAQPLGASKQAAQPLPPAFDTLAGLAIQAASENNFNLSLAMAIHQQDWQGVTQLAQRLLAEISAEGGLTPLTGIHYFRLLSDALSHMPARQFARSIWPVMATLPNAQLLKIQLLRFMPETFNKLQVVLNQDLLSDAQFSALAISHINTPRLPGMPYFDGEAAFNRLLFSRLSSKDLLTLWEKLEREHHADNRNSSLKTALVKHILQHPIGQQDWQSVNRLLQSYLMANQQKTASCSNMAVKLLLLDVLPANRALLLEHAAQFAGFSAQCEQLPQVLQHYFDGNPSASYQALLRLIEDATTGISQFIFEPLVESYFRAEKHAYIQQVLATQTLSRDEARRFINNVVRQEGSMAVKLNYLQHLHSALPDEPLIFNLLSRALWQTKQLPALESLLADRATKGASSDELHLLYYLHQLNKQLSGAAGMAGQAIQQIDALVEWLNKSMSADAEQQSVVALYSQVFKQYAEHYPGDPLVIELRARQATTQQSSAESGKQADLSRVARLYQEQPDQALRVLNTLWRNGIDGGSQFDNSRLTRHKILYEWYDLNGQPQASGASQLDLLAEMAGHPAATAMYYNWLLALPEDDRRIAQRLYRLIAQGWQQQGLIDHHVSRLLVQLTAQNFSQHELQLLASALPASSVNLDTGQLAALKQRAQSMTEVSAYLRLALAEVFARQGQYDEAGQLLLAATWQINYPAATMQSRIIQSRYDAPKLLDAVRQLATWPDKSLASDYLNKILAISADSLAQDADVQPYWQAFVLFAHGQLGVTLKNADAGLTQPAHKALSPMLTLAKAYYLAASLNDNEASTELVVTVLTDASPVDNKAMYNPAINSLNSRLYGPLHSQSLQSGLSILANNASPAWRQMMQLKLAQVADQRARPELVAEFRHLLAASSHQHPAG